MKWLVITNFGFSCTTHAGTEYLPLTKVKEATKEVCSDWYSLAVELEISYRFRKVGVVTGYIMNV